MMKDVVISIRSLTEVDSDEDGLAFVTDGLYSYDDGVACLSYLETEVTGLEGTRTSLIVLPDKVVVDRDGTLTSRMIFMPGQRSAFQYDTPVGTATMQMDTHSITQRFDERGGEMEINYVLGLEHAVISRNRFRLNVREQTAPRTYAAQ